jgi:hypothetical protein
MELQRRRLHYDFLAVVLSQKSLHTLSYQSAPSAQTVYGCEKAKLLAQGLRLLELQLNEEIKKSKTVSKDVWRGSLWQRR